ncbi:MAG: hypothetical protein DRJ97_04165 [Thermoprotei archaeon]|nr:MAG: hypothetical protein DRJ97_04165 [Thermoprotei archaeon]
MEAKKIALIGGLSALTWALASFNRLLPRGVGHVTIDAILCTFVLLLSVRLIGRGAPLTIGFIVGLLMPLLGGKPIAIPSWTARGLAISGVLYALRHKACCLKCCSLAASLSFLAQTMIGYVLNLALFINPKAWAPFTSFMLTVALVGSMSSLIGGLLTVKLSHRIEGAVGATS